MKRPMKSLAKPNSVRILPRDQISPIARANGVTFA
jgi:hypothetical protein